MSQRRKTKRTESKQIPPQKATRASAPAISIRKKILFSLIAAALFFVTIETALFVAGVKRFSVNVIRWLAFVSSVSF